MFTILPRIQQRYHSHTPYAHKMLGSVQDFDHNLLFTCTPMQTQNAQFILERDGTSELTMAFSHWSPSNFSTSTRTTVPGSKQCGITPAEQGQTTESLPVHTTARIFVGGGLLFFNSQSTRAVILHISATAHIHTILNNSTGGMVLKAFICTFIIKSLHLWAQKKQIKK